jgi:pilus assembly protein CpaE
MRGALTRRRVEEALKLKVDVVMPDLPRSIQSAATMGEAVAGSRNGFSRGIVELARQTAFVRLLDAPKGARDAAQSAKGRRWRLFSWA